MQLFQKISNDDEIKPGIIELVHFENVNNFLFSSKEAQNIPVFYNEFKRKKKLMYSIIIGESNMHFGIARMIQTLFEINDPRKDLFVVHTEEEATLIIKKLHDSKKWV